MFPEWEKRVPGSASKNLEQHHGFHNGLEAVRAYAEEARLDPSKYDGSKVIAMLDEFGDNLRTHLDEEIDTLGPAKLSHVFKSPEEAKQLHEDAIKEALKNIKLSTALPFVSDHLGLANCR
jgi:hypothetical protein